jgi:AcrR family transcriptional regulator
MDATLESLIEMGWTGTSTTEVVRRAGLSRGAQVHHFPSKEDLVLAAIEHLEQRRTEEYRLAFQNLPAHERTGAAAFDLLRAQCSGPTADAWLELAIAARTDPVLRARFNQAEERFWASAVANFEEMFPALAADPVSLRVALRFAFCLVDGMAVCRLAGTDPAELDAVADAFKELIAPFEPSIQGPTP